MCALFSGEIKNNYILGVGVGRYQLPHLPHHHHRHRRHHRHNFSTAIISAIEFYVFSASHTHALT
jgi:hypothetical protein